MRSSHDDNQATDWLPSASSSDQVITKWFFLGLLVYFTAHIIFRVLVSSSLEQDEAEQVLFSQWLRGTYRSTPPLYTWLQMLFFRVFGTNLFSLSLLKNGLLFATYTFVFLSARILLGGTRQALLASLSLLLIPQISWESQRDLTHSVLATTFSAATLFTVLALLESAKLKSYLGLGLAVGLGMLTKYNYALFLSAVLLSLLSYQRGRSLLFSRKFLLTLVIALVFWGPYCYWLASNWDAATSSVHKLNIVEHDFILVGAVNLVVACVSFVAPVALVYLFIFPQGYARFFRNRPAREFSFPMPRYFIFLFTLFVIMILFWRVTFFKDRWMQPLLFLFPLYFLIYVEEQFLSEKAVRNFTAIALAVALIILTLIPGRIVLGPSLGYLTDFNYPYQALAEKIREHGSEPNLIIVDWSENAGNIRFQFTGSLVLTPKLGLMQPVENLSRSTMAVIWDTREAAEMPLPLQAFLTETLQIRLKDLQIIHVRLPYQYSRDHFATVGIGLLNRNKD